MDVRERSGVRVHHGLQQGSPVPEFLWLHVPTCWASSGGFERRVSFVLKWHRLLTVTVEGPGLQEAGLGGNLTLDFQGHLSPQTPWASPTLSALFFTWP